MGYRSTYGCLYFHAELTDVTSLISSQTHHDTFRLSAAKGHNMWDEQMDAESQWVKFLWSATIQAQTFLWNFGWSPTAWKPLWSCLKREDVLQSPPSPPIHQWVVSGLKWHHQNRRAALVSGYLASYFPVEGRGDMVAIFDWVFTVLMKADKGIKITW